MERLTELVTVLDRVWRRLERAAEEPGHPFRTLTFGTVIGGTPDLRTVILRGADVGERSLAFHTDRRSQKVADLQSHGRICWHGWDAEAHEQVRLRGAGAVHVDDAVANEMWETQAPGSLVHYSRSAAPGMRIDGPDDGLDAALKDRPIQREDIAEGRPHFAVVRTVIDEIDWLHLHPEGHYRAQFQLRREQNTFEGSWVVP